MSEKKFKFRKNDRIGSAGAEEDKDFLLTCFIDTGDLDLLLDVTDNRQIVLGRTGAGKSALLLKIQEDKNDFVVNISPENLALTYVSNSTILNFFSKLGVNLDPFFKLLWRHVFTVEVLKRHFELHGEKNKKSLIDTLSNLFKGDSRHDKEMKQAISYLKEWGESFWLETEFRVKEITQKVEKELDAEIKAQLGNKANNLGSSLRAVKKLSEDQKAELISRGQNIISSAQVQDLHKVMMLLDSVLNDRQKQYYILIDGLDENWVEERLRYKLIIALILTAKDFIRVKNAKVIIALRRDLVERVFKLTRESGFQEEKYQSLYLPINWSREELIDLLDKRINTLVSSRYTSDRLTHLDLLPKKINKQPVTEFFLERAKRPRDIIAFFNSCILAAKGASKLNVAELKNAEGEYSRDRLRALADEWSADYPSLLEFAMVLRRRPHSFKISLIENKVIEDLCLRVVAENPAGQGILQKHAMQLVNCVVPAEDFKVLLMQIFYRIGLVGLKLQPYEKETWVDERGRSISIAEINETTSVVIHPAFHRALGIQSN